MTVNIYIYIYISLVFILSICLTWSWSSKVHLFCERRINGSCEKQVYVRLRFLLKSCSGSKPVSCCSSVWSGWRVSKLGCCMIQQALKEREGKAKHASEAQSKTRHPLLMSFFIFALTLNLIQKLKPTLAFLDTHKYLVRGWLTFDCWLCIQNLSVNASSPCCYQRTALSKCFTSHYLFTGLVILLSQDSERKKMTLQEQEGTKWKLKVENTAKDSRTHGLKGPAGGWKSIFENERSLKVFNLKLTVP